MAKEKSRLENELKMNMKKLRKTMKVIEKVSNIVAKDVIRVRNVKVDGKIIREKYRTTLYLTKKNQSLLNKKKLLLERLKGKINSLNAEMKLAA